MQLKNSKIDKQTFVWFLNDNNKFVRGNINNSLDSLKICKEQSTSSQLVPVHTSDGEIIYKSPSQLYPADSEFGFSDNCSLLYLTIPNVAYNIKKRFKSVLKGNYHGIYTFTGSILIAVNPYRPLPCLYDEKTLVSYVGKTQSANPPHPFAIAEAAYTALLKHNKSQSIIISGESGSGKTECSKHVLRYLAYNSSQSNTDQEKYAIENRVLETNPVLEAFGNATTVRNVNSSRFGKLIKLHFDKAGHISHGSMSTYLLAKSRVSKVPANERNYHIFYWLCLEATPEERENLYINNMEHYRFLDSDCTLSMPSNFERVRKAMDVINLSKEVDQIDVFKTLSIILTLGNLEFTTGLRKRDFEDNATIISRSSKIGSTSETSLSVREKADSLDVLHQLLKFESPESQNTFELALTSKKICDTRCNLPIHQAKQNVNALARHLYQKLFNYLVSQINIMLDDHDMLHDQSMNDEAQQTQTKEITENFISDNTKVITSSKHDEAYVGVLDIFGFEDMLPYSCNGFEQLCINYANEQLHTFFLDQLIVNDLKVYHSENIQPPRNVSENCTAKSVSCCNAIYNCLPHGLPGVFQLLDEASLAPVVGHKDFYFCRKVNTTLGHRIKSGHGSLIGGVVLGKKNFDLDKEFLIRHYAGDVLYTAENFNFQNLDFLPQDLEISLRCCENDFISKILFKEDNDFIMERKSQKKKISRNSEVFSKIDNKPHATQNNHENIKTSKSKTLSSVFCSQVKFFIGELEKTVSWFIRCVKPNEKQNFTDWDEIRVRQQLENSGMIVALEWMVCGYPCRVPFEELWKRYGHLLPLVMRSSVTPDEFARLIFLVIGTNPSDFQLGKTCAFFRLGSLYDIETLKDVARGDERRIVAQRIYEFWLRKRLKRSFFLVRCLIRLSRILCYNRCFKLAKEAQQYYYTKVLNRRNKILVIQRAWRDFCIKKQLICIAKSKISSFCLRWIRCRRFHKSIKYVSNLQTLVRVRLRREKYSSCITLVELIQSCSFTTIRRNNFWQNHQRKRETKAVIFIQTWWKHKKRPQLQILISGKGSRDVLTDDVVDTGFNCDQNSSCDNETTPMQLNDDVNNQVYRQERIIDQPLQKRSEPVDTQSTLSIQDVLCKSPVTSCLSRKSLDYISNTAEKQFICSCEKEISDRCDFTTKPSPKLSPEQAYSRTSLIHESYNSSASNEKLMPLEIVPTVSVRTRECRSDTNGFLTSELQHTLIKKRNSIITPTRSMTTPRYYQAALLDNSTDEYEIAEKDSAVVNNFPNFDLQKPQVNIISTGTNTSEYMSSRDPNSTSDKSFIRLLSSPTHNIKTISTNRKDYSESFKQDICVSKNTSKISSCIPEPSGITLKPSLEMLAESSPINRSSSRNSTEIFSPSVISTNKTLKNTPRICFLSPTLNSNTSKITVNTFSQSFIENNNTSENVLRIFSTPATLSNRSKSVEKYRFDSSAQKCKIPQTHNTLMSDFSEERINPEKFNPDLFYGSTQNRLSISKPLVVSLESPPQQMVLSLSNSDALPESPQPSQPLPLPRSSLVLLNNEMTQSNTLVSSTKNKDVSKSILRDERFSNDLYPLRKNRVSETYTTHVNVTSKQLFFTEEPNNTLDNLHPKFFKRRQDSSKRRWSVVSEVRIPSTDSLKATEPIIEHKRKKLGSHPTVLRRSRSDSSTFLNLDSQGFHVNNNLSNLVEYQGDTKNSHAHTKSSEPPIYLPELSKKRNSLKYTFIHDASKELNIQIKSSSNYKGKQFFTLDQTPELQNNISHVPDENMQCFNNDQIRFVASLLDCKENICTETHHLTKEKKATFSYPYDNKPKNFISDYVDTKYDKRNGSKNSSKTSESSSPVHVISKADFRESPMSLKFNLLENSSETNQNSKLLINPLLLMPQHERNRSQDNDTQSLNGQSKNYPCQSPLKHQIYPDPRRVSWLFMEGSLLGDITAKDSSTPISIHESLKKSSFSVSSEKRGCSVICPEEDMASPLLSYRSVLPNPVAVNSFIENSHLPSRRSIIITDEILFAKEGLTKTSKPDIPPSNTVAPFPNFSESFEEPSLLKRTPSATAIFPKSRIPRLRRRKRVLHHQPISEDVQTSVSNFTIKNLGKNSGSSLKKLEIPSNNFIFTSTNGCHESKFIHTNMLGPPKTFHSRSSTKTLDDARTQAIDKVPTLCQNKLSRFREETNKSYCASSKLPRLK